VDKILSKLIKLKTYIKKDPLNKKEILKEFLLKNGFNNNIFYEDKSLNNFYNYLQQPFTFPAEYNLSQVIKEAINFKCKEVKKIKNNYQIHCFWITKLRKKKMIIFQKRVIENLIIMIHLTNMHIKLSLRKNYTKKNASIMAIRHYQFLFKNYKMN
jgi:hypothetical protein